MDNSEHKSKYTPNYIKLMPPLDGIIEEINNRLKKIEYKSKKIYLDLSHIQRDIAMLKERKYKLDKE